MTYLKSWEDFEVAAEKLFIQFPEKSRYTMKYNHAKNMLYLKLTNDVVCLQYKTDLNQDLRRIDKFINNLIRHMVTSH